MLLMRYKEIYDGIFSMRLLIRNDGSVGIVFRARDPFNYYVLDIRRESGDKGQKRIRKFVNGKSHEVFKVNDGGYQ